MRSTFFAFLFLAISSVMTTFSAVPADKGTPKPLRVGYSVTLTGVTPEKMKYAKSVGVDCIETSFAAFIDKQTLSFKFSAAEMTEKVKQAKKAADDAGIEIWSVHMPFGEEIDISLADESQRRKVVELHSRILEFCRILQPKVILFHPSWYLRLNERELRKSRMIESALELNKKVKDIHAIMVIENMLGPKLQKDSVYERPLCRSVEETKEIMGRLPDDIYSAIDMNHIKNPQDLIRAMGRRLKSVHIADGNGEKESHFFPCSGQGENNWTDILSALEEAHYTGPFMYESHFKDVKDMKECYDSLYQKFITAKNR